MKYIFLGTIAPEWIGRHKERLQSCKAKAVDTPEVGSKCKQEKQFAAMAKRKIHAGQV